MFELIVGECSGCIQEDNGNLWSNPICKNCKRSPFYEQLEDCYKTKEENYENEDKQLGLIDLIISRREMELLE